MLGWILALLLIGGMFVIGVWALGSPVNREKIGNSYMWKNLVPGLFVLILGLVLGFIIHYAFDKGHPQEAKVEDEATIIKRYEHGQDIYNKIVEGQLTEEEKREAIFKLSR